MATQILKQHIGAGQDIPEESGGVAINVWNLLNNAKYQESTVKTYEDQIQLQKYLNGEITYDQMNQYIKNRQLENISQETKLDLLKMTGTMQKEKAGEKADQDQLMINKFKAGEVGYDEVKNYFGARQLEATTPEEKASLENYRLTAQETSQNLEDNSAILKVQNGEWGLKDLNDYLSTRLAQEKPGSDQYIQLEDAKRTAGNQYQIAEINRKYNSGEIDEIAAMRSYQAMQGGMKPDSNAFGDINDRIITLATNAKNKYGDTVKAQLDETLQRLQYNAEIAKTNYDQAPDDQAMKDIYYKSVDAVNQFKLKIPVATSEAQNIINKSFTPDQIAQLQSTTTQGIASQLGIPVTSEGKLQQPSLATQITNPEQLKSAQIRGLYDSVMNRSARGASVSQGEIDFWMGQNLPIEEIRKRFMESPEYTIAQAWKPTFATQNVATPPPPATNYSNPVINTPANIPTNYGQTPQNLYNSSTGAFDPASGMYKGLRAHKDDAGVWRDFYDKAIPM